MRKLQKPPVAEAKTSKKEPLAEGLQITVPTDSRGRLWSKMSDEQIVEYAKKIMKEGVITGKNELENADCGLYAVLRKKGLIDRVGFDEKRRSWKDMDKEQILDFAKRVIKEHSISTKSELYQIDSGLCSVLNKRKLFDRIKLEVKHRPWNELSNDEILELAKRLVIENGIVRKHGLMMADSGLHKALRKRGLLDEVGFAEKRTKMRSWKNMSDEEIVGYTRRLMEEKGITGRKELGEADHGLYKVLIRRELLDEVGFEEKQKKYRKRRSWKDMKDSELIDFAIRIMKEQGMGRRKDLEDADSGLYSILRKRKLLDHVFARIDQQKTDNARDAVIDALEAFGANDNNSAEDDVA